MIFHRLTQDLLKLIRETVDIVQERVMLHTVPDALDPLLGLGAQRALLDTGYRAPELLQARSPDDDGVALGAIEDRVVDRPAEGQLRRRDALRLGDRVPLVQRAEDRGPVEVQVLVELSDETLGVPPALAFLELLLGLGEEAAGDWAVGVEGN